MKRVLILYGSTHGQTAKIAAAIGRTIVECGAFVDGVDAKRAGDFVRADEFDAVIVAASIHAGGYQRAVGRWVRRNVSGLSTRPTAFLSVCLGVLEHREGPQAEVRKIARTFYESRGWEPTALKIVAGALPYSKYSWITRWLMRRIVAKAGGDIDTSRDYEYTDWNDLRSFAEDFARQAGIAPAAAVAALAQV